MMHWLTPNLELERVRFKSDDLRQLLDQSRVTISELRAENAKLQQQLAVVQEREAVPDDESLPEIPEGFIRHDGLGHPFLNSKKVVVIYRDGKSIENLSGNISPWSHSGVTYDIIAYKIME